MPCCNNLLPLKCGVQHYAWGCRAGQGTVPYIADLLNLAPEDKPWAELWLGAHPKLPAMVQLNDGTEKPLDQLIDSAPQEMIGEAADGEGILPFLLKVLSCSAPLSIQSHPDKKTAARLHREHPEWYPDDNHKPEMMLALTDFEAMCGFRRCSEIEPDLERHSGLSIWLEKWQGTIAECQGLKGLCSSLFELSQEEVSRMIFALQEELSFSEDISDSDLLFQRLLTAYPDDRGAFFAYLLNHITLKPGEAVFVSANQPHAYLNGTGVECMANSDNVIRAGLTSKVIDVKNLMDTLDFFPEPFQLMKTFASQAGATTYVSPVDEFQVTMLNNCRTYDWNTESAQAGIVLVLQGTVKIEMSDGRAVEGKRGDSWFKPAAMTQCRVSGSEDSLIALAISNL